MQNKFGTYFYTCIVLRTTYVLKVHKLCITCKSPSRFWNYLQIQTTYIDIHHNTRFDLKKFINCIRTKCNLFQSSVIIRFSTLQRPIVFLLLLSTLITHTYKPKKKPLKPCKLICFAIMKYHSYKMEQNNKHRKQQLTTT